MRSAARHTVLAPWLVRLLAVGVLATTSVAAGAHAQSATTPTSSSFSGVAAKAQVDVLAGRIGSRPAGSEAYDQAAQYAVDELRQWGYESSLQSFPVQAFYDRGSVLEVTSSSAGPIRVPTDTLAYSMAGQVDAPLVAAGLGQASDLLDVDVRGKLVLVQRGALRFSEKVANAAAAGAVGVIVYNTGPDGVQGSLGTPQAVPAVTISGRRGQQLLDLLASGSVWAQLGVDSAVEQRASTNVVAELAAQRPDAGVVVFGAHLDSVSAGPGANDNASGAAVVLELAHHLAQRPSLDRQLTVRFVLFGAEEIGLNGSRAHVQALSSVERRAILAAINLDMVGVGDSWRFGGTEDLVQRALGAANDLGLRALPMRGPMTSSSDHMSFISADIPAVFIHRAEDPNYHTANDRAERVDAEALGQAGDLALRLLDMLSTP